MDLKHWLAGLVAAFVNGVASAVVLLLADPVAFNFDTGLKKLLSTSALFGILGAANFLKKSPIPDKIVGLAILLLVLPFSAGCSLLTANARHTGVVVETGIAKSLFAVQDLAKDSAVSFPDVMTPERFKAFNHEFVPVLELGLQVNRTVRAWPVGQPAPAELSSLVAQLKTLSDKALATLPAGDVKTKLSAAVKIALDAALAVFNSLPHGGTTNEVVHPLVLAPVGG